ncbi:hypothetical protein KEM60_03334 [Austwickia sp. TVS 96-490-7B]|nr:hypothetical protein [Austwickia sp. TVS 96-490-7B]
MDGKGAIATRKMPRLTVIRTRGTYDESGATHPDWGSWSQKDWTGAHLLSAEIGAIARAEVVEVDLILGDGQTGMSSGHVGVAQAQLGVIAAPDEMGADSQGKPMTGVWSSDGAQFYSWYGWYGGCVAVWRRPMQHSSIDEGWCAKDICGEERPRVDMGDVVGAHLSSCREQACHLAESSAGRGSDDDMFELIRSMAR